MQAYLGTIVFKFGRDPVICLREEAMYMYIMYIMYIVTNRLQYFAPASGRSNKKLQCAESDQPVLSTNYSFTRLFSQIDIPSFLDPETGFQAPQTLFLLLSDF